MRPKMPTSSNYPIDEGGIEKKEYFFNQIIHQLPGAIFICDKAGRIIYFTNDAADLWGYKPEIGKKKWCGSYKLFHLDGQPLDPEYTPMAIAIKEMLPVHAHEMIMERPDGIRRNIISHSKPILDKDGTIMGAFTILEDITEKKIHEDQIGANNFEVIINHIRKAILSELELENVVQAITDAATKASGAQFGAFFYNDIKDEGENYSLYTISGVSKDSFSNFPMPRNTEIFGPTFHGTGIVRSDDITKDLRYGKNPPYQGMPSGHLPVKSFLSVPVISRTGEVLGGLFLGHSKPGVFSQQSENLIKDIAAHAAIALDNSRLYEASKIDKEKLAVINSELNEKNEELQKINIDLDNFIYIASHDLKSPVSNIEGLLSTLSEMVNGENSSKEEINSILKMMDYSIDRFLNTLNDLTTITKIQKDIEQEIPEKVNILELIDDIKMLNGDLIANTGARIVVDFDSFREISFSRKNLKSILFNLITNALKYRSPDRKPEIRISLEKNGTFLLLKVKDNGLGLEANKQKKLFSMFQRFHDHVEGTGIGLYLVKRIITNAGGKVEVESQLNVGSTFTVFFKENN